MNAESAVDGVAVTATGWAKHGVLAPEPVTVTTVYWLVAAAAKPGVPVVFGAAKAIRPFGSQPGATVVWLIVPSTAAEAAAGTSTSPNIAPSVARRSNFFIRLSSGCWRLGGKTFGRLQPKGGARSL